jgi:hypothetical protein
MGMIVGGSRNSDTQCRTCVALAFAPLTDRGAFQQVTCDCGIIYGIDPPAAEEYHRLREQGVELQPDHWGDERAGGLVEILTVAKEAAEWIVLLESGRRGLVNLRRRLVKERPLTRDEAVGIAMNAVLKQEHWLDRVLLAPTSAEWIDGVARVGLCSDNFEWTIEVRRVRHVTSYRVVEEPAWTPDR